ELHLDRSPVHEIELLLDLVGVERALVTGGHDDRVDAERAHAQALADLAEAGAVAEIVEVADGVAVGPPHLGVLRSLHLGLLAFVVRAVQWSATCPSAGGWALACPGP